MILKEKAPDVIVSGDFQETTFSMDTSNEHIIFDILRSKVYKNNIGAICREVASNSRDAQREIGDFDTPIEIEISDKRKSYLYEDGLNIIFRDKGIGISPERVQNIYTKYGASTKRDTNTQTGGFGLGAKTPFSYSDAFIVRTVVDNVEYIYSIYIDTSRKGKMALLQQEEFNSPFNLTEVIVPVRANDLTRFEQEVIRNTYFWAVRPTLINFKTEYPTIEYPIITGPSVGISKGFKFEERGKYVIYKKHEFLESNINVIIDGIYYPADPNILGYNFNSFNFAVCLFFDNGQLGISANRETLQYDDDTIMTLKSTFESTLDIFRQEYLDYIQKCPILFDAQILYNSFHANDQFFKYIFQYKKITYDIPGSNPVDSVILGDTLRHQSNSVDFIHMKYDYNGKIQKTNVNIFSAEMRDYKNNIFWITRQQHEDKKMRLSIGINRALLLNNRGCIVMIEKTKDVFYGHNFDMQLDDTKNFIKKIGLTYKNYWEVEPLKIKSERKKKETITLKSWVNGVYSSGADFYYDSEECYFLEDGEPVEDMYYLFLEEERTIQPNVKQYMIDVSQLLHRVKPNARIAVCSKLKKKYFSNYISIEEFMEQESVTFKKIYERYKLDGYIAKTRKYDGIKFDKIIQDELDYLNELAIVKEIKLWHISDFFKQRMPKFDLTLKNFDVVFQSINKQYPLLESVNHTVTKEYVELVNQLNAYKQLVNDNGLEL